MQEGSHTACESRFVHNGRANQANPAQAPTTSPPTLFSQPHFPSRRVLQQSIRIGDGHPETIASPPQMAPSQYLHRPKFGVRAYGNEEPRRRLQRLGGLCHALARHCQCLTASESVATKAVACRMPEASEYSILLSPPC